jgi:hypothetical protein
MRLDSLGLWPEKTASSLPLAVSRPNLEAAPAGRGDAAAPLAGGDSMKGQLDFPTARPEELPWYATASPGLVKGMQVGVKFSVNLFYENTLRQILGRREMLAQDTV